MEFNFSPPIPEQQKGDCQIRHFTVSEKEAQMFNLQTLMSRSNRLIRPGTYMKLIQNRTLVMSNTPAEIDDFYNFLY